MVFFKNETPISGRVKNVGQPEVVTLYTESKLNFRNSLEKVFAEKVLLGCEERCNILSSVDIRHMASKHTICRYLRSLYGEGSFAYSSTNIPLLWSYKHTLSCKLWPDHTGHIHFYLLAKVFQAIIQDLNDVLAVVSKCAGILGAVQVIVGRPQ